MEKAVATENLPLVLPSWTAKHISIQAVLLVAASFLLPAGAHALGLPVRNLLPMHWPVLLVGLCYGWRSGAIVGLAAPGLSYLLSGHPLPHILPSMTIELATYGAIAGLLRGTFRWNSFLAIAAAVMVGRIVFLSFVFATGAVPQTFGVYLQAAMLPGIYGAIAQIIVLPLIAKVWVSHETKGQNLEE